VIKKKKQLKRIAYKKRGVIALVYHYVSKKIKEEFFNKQQAIVDNQTDEIVSYMKRLFIRRGYKVQMLKVSPDNLTALKKLKADFVFNLVDSKAMEVRIAKILDRVRIPHSGSSFEAIKTSNNKIKSKRLFEKNKLPTPKYSLISPTVHLTRALIPGKFPVIIKPAFEHCSIGITDNSIATTYEQFKRIIRSMRKKYKQTLLAEQFIPGKELQVTVMETPNKTVALPIAEIAFDKTFKNKWNIYGFDEKWSKNLPAYKSCHFVAPPKRLNMNIDAQIKRDSIRAFYALGMKDYARFDLRYNPKIHQWYFLEANANAGFDPDVRDAMTVSVLAHGMTLDDFVLQIVKNSIN